GFGLATLRRFGRFAGFLPAGGATRLLAERFGAGIEQHHRFGEGDRLRRLVAGDGGVDAVVADVRPVAAVLDHDLTALVGMFAQYFARVGTKAPALFWVGFLLRDQ